MNFLTNLDMNQNQIMNVVLQKLAVAPSNPTSGQMYFNTVEERAFIYNGKDWLGMDSIGATMTGENIVTTINLSSSLIDDKNLSQAVRDAISKSHSSHTISDVTGLQGALDSKETPSGAQSKVDTHGNKKDNPHAVTKAQVGLGNVDNTSDLGKPISTATQNALNGKVDNSRVLTDVPANAKFTDTNTTYSEITTAEIDVGTASTGRTITGRRVKYILDKVSSMISVAIGALSKSSVGLGNVDNTSDVSKPISTATQSALDGKVNTSQVKTDVPTGAKFTDTVTTINGKTGTILKADITALGIPAQDTKYTHPTTDGNKHVPATGTTNSGKVLKAGATAGSLAWEVDNDTITTINGKTGAISKSDIVALGIPAQDTTYTPFTTAKDGLVPKTTSSNTTDYLRRDGTWASPPDTKYTLPTATSTVLGGIKSGTDITIDTSGNVSVNDNSHGHTIANVTGLQGALDSKETPSGATAKASTAEDNAKGYTDSKIADLIGSAPETLDTLHEIAEALGEDPNFATTILDRLAEKTKKHVASVGDGTKTSFVLTHNLNTRDINVMIRQTASPYAMVITDVEMTTENTVTVKFAEAPASSEYTVTIVG